jgi:hypothetical protein
MEKPFVFRLPRDRHEFERAIEHISDHMFQVYGARPNPHETPEHLFLVSQEDRIISTIGVDFGQESKKLTFEKTFRFENKDLPFLYSPDKTVFFSRWTTKVDRLGVAVWCLATRYAIAKGYKYNSSIGKPIVYQLMQEYGCKWQKIKNAQPFESNISAYDYAYYFSKPQPSPHLGILRQQITKMSLVTEHLITKGMLVVNV